MLNLLTDSDLILLFVMAAIFTAALLLLGGCHGMPLPTPQPDHWYSWHTPNTLKDVNHGLDALILLSIVALSAAVATFIFVPAGHRLSSILAVSAGSVLAVSLLIKVTLPAVPWIAGILCVTGLALLTYEIVYKVKTGTFDKPGDGQGNL